MDITDVQRSREDLKNRLVVLTKQLASEEALKRQVNKDHNDNIKDFKDEIRGVMQQLEELKNNGDSAGTEGE